MGANEAAVETEVLHLARLRMAPLAAKLGANHARMHPRMRFLGIGDYLSLGDLYLRLAQTGHEVRVHVAQSEAHGILAGMIARVDDWRAELEWVRDGIIVFETASHGAIADQLRRDGYRVIGGSEYGDRLENDRAFGQRVMRGAGMRTAPTHAFDEVDAALAFLAAHPGRYVYKLSDDTAASTRNYIGELEDGRDLVALLASERDAGTRAPFVLMEHLTGVEVGIGAYFDGEHFMEPAVVDWEHKRFFPGDLGELTGEMGTVVSYRNAKRLFDATLGRIVPQLRAARHVGYLNINTIVNERGVWPLEFTMRFGYPGFAICDALHLDRWDTIFARMCAPTGFPQSFATRDGFAVGVVLTVPPFPHEYGYAELSKGAPIFFRDSLTDDDRTHLHYGEVALRDGQLVAAGSLGYLMVVTGIGAGIRAAQTDAYARARKIVVQNLRYRNDIGDRLAARDYDTLVQLGHVDS